jgi:hypothetical protein
VGVLTRSSSRRLALHDLVLSLARSADVVEFARSVAHGWNARDRIGRVAAAFTFVSHLVDVPPPEDDGFRDGVDSLLQLAGAREGPAVILCALLLALGERASLDEARGLPFVRVEIDAADLRRLPPHAGPFVDRGRLYLPLDSRDARSALGFLPGPMRDGLVRRRLLSS